MAKNKKIKKLMSFKILDIPVIPTALGSFLLLSTMFMWYGGFFVERFQPLMNITEDQVDTESLGIWYPIGILSTIIQGIGIAILLKWRGWPNTLVSAKTAATAALTLGAMVFSYRLIILPEHSIELFLINSSGLFVAWTLAAITISLLYPKDV